MNELNASSMTLPAAAIYRGLKDVSDATADIAQYLLAHPHEVTGATQAAKAIGQRFSELTDAAMQFDGSNSKLNNMVEEMRKAVDWCDYRFPDGNGGRCIPVSNSAVDVVGAFGRISDFN